MVLSGLFNGSKVLLMYLFHSLVSFSAGMLNSLRISFSIVSARDKSYIWHDWIQTWCAVCLISLFLIQTGTCCSGLTQRWAAITFSSNNYSVWATEDYWNVEQCKKKKKKWKRILQNRDTHTHTQHNKGSIQLIHTFTIAFTRTIFKTAPRYCNTVEMFWTEINLKIFFQPALSSIFSLSTFSHGHTVQCYF